MSFWSSLFGWLKPQAKVPVMRHAPVAHPPTSWWLCPNVASPDLVEVITGLPANVTVQLYPYSFLDGPASIIGPNGRSAVSPAVRSRHVAVELGSVKGNSVEFQIQDGWSIRAIIEAQGGSISSIAMDEPLTFAKQNGISVVDAIDRVGKFIAAFNCDVGWIEAYPTIPIAEWIGKSDPMAQRPKFFHVDLDLNAVMKANALMKAAEDMRWLQRLARERNTPLGVIVWGCDEQSEASFLASAKRLVGFFQDTFRQDWPDRVIVQSWMTTGEHTLPSARVLLDLLNEVRTSVGG